MRTYHAPEVPEGGRRCVHLEGTIVCNLLPEEHEDATSLEPVMKAARRAVETWYYGDRVHHAALKELDARLKEVGA